MQGICIFIFSLLIWNSAHAQNIPDCCQISYFDELEKEQEPVPDSEKTWAQLFSEGGEPKSLLASTILGFKIGVFIGIPFVVPTLYFQHGNKKQIMLAVLFVSFIGGPTLVDFCYVLGRALNYFNLYDGLDGPPRTKTRPYIMTCDCD